MGGVWERSGGKAYGRNWESLGELLTHGET